MRNQRHGEADGEVISTNQWQNNEQSSGNKLVLNESSISIRYNRAVAIANFFWNITKMEML